MLNWAVIFLIIAVVAAIFGFSGIAGAAVNIAWILAVIGIVLAIAFFVDGLDLTVRTANQAEDYLDLPVLASMSERRRRNG